MKRKKLMYIWLVKALILLTYVGAHGQTKGKKWISLLKNSEAYAVTSDGKKLKLTINRVWNSDKCNLSINNNTSQALSIREVVIFDLAHQLPYTTPIYGEGFQMLAQMGGTLSQPKDFTTYSDRKHYKIPEPENLTTVYGMLTLQIDSNNRLLLATTSCNKFISRFSFDAHRLRISMDCEGLTLPPGVSWNLEEFIALTGNDREVLYDKLTSAIAVNHPKLPCKTAPMGWCSWYCFGPRVTAKNVADNTTWIAKNIPALQTIQIDDGYQPWMGDWMESGKAFNGGVQQVLKQIKDQNLKPAIWLAPFIASPDSKIFKEHPDWMVKDNSGQPLSSDKIGFGGWRQGPWYVLDGTHPEVQQHLTKLFKIMREQWGCTYFKLDANYWGAIHGGVHYDKNATRIEAYRRGMEAIRKGSGDAFLLGCNHPIWASLGQIHGSRSSGDVRRAWVSFKKTSTQNLLRGWQNGRLWWNDPDCLLLLNETGDSIMDPGGKTNPARISNLTNDEFIYHATAIYASGGMLLSGDDLTKISAEKFALMKKILPPTGITARFKNESLEIGLIPLKDKPTYVVFNAGDSTVSRTITLPAGEFELIDKWTEQSLGIYQTSYTLKDMPKHSARIIETRKVKR